MNNDITVILNGFRRPEWLSEQVMAVNNQTIRPMDIMYWQNTVQGLQYDTNTIDHLKSAVTNINYGVWSRFAYALNARTNWICVFDDDTIPGNQWFENCLDTHDRHPGLLGTIGLFFNRNSYTNGNRVGWDNPNETAVQVDIVGHSWFFHRDMLSVFWRDLPPLDAPFNAGEDIHFSHMIQKYTNYKTWVPPHPVSNKNMWGSLKGWEYGDDGRATAIHNMDKMESYLQYAKSRGFETL